MNAFRLIVSSLIGLMLFSTLACRHSAKITSFTASPTSFTAGDSAQLCYELVNAVSARIDPNVGELNDKNKSCLKVEPRQTTNYTLSASGDDGNTTSTQLTVNVEAPPPLANIVTFEVKRETTATDPGSPAELCYEVSGASSLSIKPDIGNVEPTDKGCRTVKPNKTTTYELAATGTDNQAVTKQAIVTVVQPPARIVRFDVSPANIKAGEKVRICYQIEDAARAYIENLNYNAVKLGQSECLDVQPTRSTIFTLKAQNLDYVFVSREARVTVEQLPVEIVDFKAQPTEIEKGQETVLHYKISNAARAQIAYPGGAVPLRLPEGDVRFKPQGTATFTLMAEDPDRKSTSQPLTVKVVPPAQARFIVKPPVEQTINYGAGVNLCYEVTWGSKVSIKSDLLKTSQNLQPPEKNCVTVKPKSPDTFTLTAIGPNGVPEEVKAKVKVLIPPPSVIFYAQSGPLRNNRILISRGDRPQLCYVLANVEESFTINPPVGSLDSMRKCVNLGELEKTTDYTLKVKGIDKITQTYHVTIEVYPAPEIIRFDGQSSGGRNFLCYQYRFGTRAEISPPIRALKPPTPSGFGSECVEVPLSPSPSYKLTVYGRGRVQPAELRFPRR